MPEELHIVKTNANPNLFDPRFASSDPGIYADQAALIERIRKQYPAMDFPFYAVLTNELAGLMEQPSIFGHEPLPDSGRSICDRIDELASGDNPITAVVDFTNSKPTLLGAYEFLKQRYKVVEHEVIDVMG